MILRDYQIDITNRTRDRMKEGYRCVLIQLGTGGGKTLLTAKMLNTAAQKGIASVFICHRRELIKQTHKAFNDLNIGHGIIGAGFPFSARPMVTIASIQTLKNKLHKIRKPGLVVFDECHHQSAKSWDTVYNAFPDAYIIGLTATPQRLDGSGLGKYYPVMVQGPSVQELIDQNYLSKYKIFAPSNVDISKVHTRMGDYVTSELASAIDKPTITGDAIKEYKKYANGKRAIVRGVSIEHSKHIAKQFNDAGIPSSHVDGTTKHEIRDAIIDSFRRGDTLVLSNVDLFSEGLDIPAVECVIDLRPTKSLILWLQFCGRALRPMENKTAIIIDHAGNTARHGLPCDDREWDLKGRDKKSKEDNGPMIRLCPQCFFACNSWKKECPECKHQFVVQAREVDHKDGELTEVDIQAIRRNKRMEEGQCKTLEDLEELGRKRGYAPAWARIRWQSRQHKKQESW
jgi:DNA repair protein RadD